MVSEKKVVEFDPAKGSPDQSKPANTGIVVGECRIKLAKELKPIVTKYFEKVDDELFAFSDKAVSSTLQELYFEAMRYIRKERENLERGYVNGVLRIYDDFWNPKIRPVPLSPQPLELDEDDFSLVENEALEEDLAISTMINKGTNLYHKDLYALNKRFAKLLGRQEVGNEENPLGPYQLCHAFSEALAPLTLELKIRLLLFKLFEQLVVSDLGVIYDELNETLVKHGVLPEISKKIKKRSNSAELGHSTETLGKGGDEVSDPSYGQALQVMQNLLSSWRSQLGVTSLAAKASQPGVTVSDSREVVGALSALQEPEFGAKLTEALQNGEENSLKWIIAERLGQQEGGPRALAQVDEDIIDMIGMIFDFILEDRNLPAPVKLIIGRLQIPIVKVAIIDKSFFSKKSHPARQLLNQLAQAGIGLSGDEDLDHNPVFLQITGAVEKVLNEFDQDVSLFAGLLAEFSAFMEQESKRSSMMENRAQQATQSKEQLLLAKKEVADLIASRLDGKSIPPRLLRFLNGTWKDVLLLGYLRKDKEPKGWQGKLALTDFFIKTLIPPTSDTDRQKVIKQIPAMHRALHNELEKISYDPKQMAIFFKELRLHHHACLTSKSAVDEGFDPALERELNAIAANLPEVDDLSVSDLTDIREEDFQEEIILMTEEAEEQGDEFLERARTMEIGEWIELTDKRGKLIRAKLSWKSKVTGLRVFVNRRGMKVAEYTLQGLASELRRGGAKVIDGKVPLMDRALSSLMTTLKHPAKMQGDGQGLLEGDEVLA